jgi:Family of unknown function (DUF5906)
MSDNNSTAAQTVKQTSAFTASPAASPVAPAVTAHPKERYDYHRPSGKYLDSVTDQYLPKKSIDAAVPSIPVLDVNGNRIPKLDKQGNQVTDASGNPICKKIPASEWVKQERAIDDTTWLPGAPEHIRDRGFREGGEYHHKGLRVRNFYRPSGIKRGDPGDVAPWRDHVYCLYPETAEHIFDWFAQRVQFPGIKINHALCLFGPTRIGKDTIIEPVVRAVGEHNVKEISPKTILSDFNAQLRSVIARINEAKDFDKFAFYERMKPIIAAPPNTINLNPKYGHQYVIPNVTGVLITSNYKVGGIFLPPDDARHHVNWSDKEKGDFPEGYFPALYDWFHSGGFENVYAFLMDRDLSKVNPKAPPEKTQAFWDIVGVSASQETSDLADALDALGNPDVVTLDQIKAVIRTTAVGNSVTSIVHDPNLRRKVPHEMADAGYSAVRNPHNKQGLWSMSGKKQVIYAKDALKSGRLSAVENMVVAVEARAAAEKQAAEAEKAEKQAADAEREAAEVLRRAVVAAARQSNDAKKQRAEAEKQAAAEAERAAWVLEVAIKELDALDGELTSATSKVAAADAARQAATAEGQPAAQEELDTAIAAKRVVATKRHVVARTVSELHLDAAVKKRKLDELQRCVPAVVGLDAKRRVG